MNRTGTHALDTPDSKIRKQQQGMRSRFRRAVSTSAIIPALLVLPATMLVGCGADPLLPLGLGPALDPVFSVLLLAAVGLLLYRLLAPRLRRPRNATGGNAEAIARERYARGEIDEDNYHRILRTLAGDR